LPVREAGHPPAPVSTASQPRPRAAARLVRQILRLWGDKSVAPAGGGRRELLKICHTRA